MINPKIRFDNFGYYFFILLGLAFLGFWPSYFVKFFNGTADFSFYVHFHAVLLILWIFVLISQPILISNKELSLHRFIGKLSYFLFPIIIISVILLAHSRITGNEKPLGLHLFVPFKDLLLLVTFYSIAIKYRHNIDIHARGMIATGIVFIEPALSRLIYNVFDNSTWGYLWVVLIIYLILVVLIVRERKQKKGRWVFPLLLGLYLIVHAIIIFQIQIGPWESFSYWFAALPLT